MVRSIDGHGLRTTRNPPSFGLTTLPALSTTSATIQGNGFVALAGLVGLAPGMGVIMMAPVSVCHHVSTIGHLLLPITWWYQIQASGLIGSPTVPSSRRLDRSRPFGHWSPHLMNA